MPASWVKGSPAAVRSLPSHVLRDLCPRFLPPSVQRGPSRWTFFRPVVDLVGTGQTVARDMPTNTAMVRLSKLRTRTCQTPRVLPIGQMEKRDAKAPMETIEVANIEVTAVLCDAVTKHGPGCKPLRPNQNEFARAGRHFLDKVQKGAEIAHTHSKG